MLVCVKYVIGFNQASTPCRSNYVPCLLWVYGIDGIWILQDQLPLTTWGKICFDDGRIF